MKSILLLLIFGVCCYSFAAAESNIKTIEDLKIYFQEEKTKEYEEFIVEEINKFFENFTERFQDGHPSIADVFKKVTTCIEKKGLVGELKKLVVNLYKNSSKKEKEEYCMNPVFNHRNLIREISDCIQDDVSLKIFVTLNEKFICCNEIWGEGYGGAIRGAVPFTVRHLSCHFLFNFFYNGFIRLMKILFGHLINRFSIISIALFVSSQIIIILHQSWKKVLQKKPFFLICLKFMNQRFRYLVNNDITPAEEDYCLPVYVAEAYEILMVKTRTIPTREHGNIADFIHVVATLLGKFPFKTPKECLPAFLPENVTINEDARNKSLEIIMDVFDNGHPSVVSTLKNLTTCLEEKGLLEKFMQYMIDSNIFLYNGTSEKIKAEYCKKHGFDFTFHIEVSICSNLLQETSENYNFKYALYSAMNLQYGSFCEFRDLDMSLFKEGFAEKVLLPDMPKIYEPIRRFRYLVNNDITPTEEDYCLPIYVTEAYEILMVKTRQFSHVFRDMFASYNHVAVTLLGKFPYKTREECF